MGGGEYKNNRAGHTAPWYSALHSLSSMGQGWGRGFNGFKGKRKFIVSKIIRL